MTRSIAATETVRTRLGPFAPAVKAAVVLVSFVWTCVVGHIGLFPFDQSIQFDGGWRIFAGQVPYRDFIMAFTPLTLAIQAAFFWVLGVNWTAYVVSAACLAVVASLSVMRTLELLFGRQRPGLVAAGGLLVGSSFQSVFGTIVFEQTAFLFTLLGVQAVCESRFSSDGRACRWFMVAGVCGGLSFLSKQNAGALTLGALVGLSVVAGLPRIRRALAFTAAVGLGASLVATLFAWWLVRYSNPANFFRFAIEVPSEVGGARIWQWPSIDPGFATGCALAFVTAVVAGVAYIRNAEFRRGLLEHPRSRIALALTAVVPAVAFVFQVTTLNQSENVIFLSGLSLTMAAGLLGLLPLSGVMRRRLSAFFFAAGLFVFAAMAYASWNRTAHDIFPTHWRLSRTLDVPGLRHLRWISPTYTINERSPEWRPEDIEGLYGYLSRRGGDFVVLSESGFLYGLLRVSPPQPLLYFVRDHYFLPQDYPALDRWILSSLRGRDIETVVRQRYNWCYFFPFPKSQRWVDENFSAGPVFGNFEVLVRKPREPAAAK